MTKQTPKIIPPLNEAPHGISTHVTYDGKQVIGRLFESRTTSGVETYVVVEPPWTRPFTKISVFKLKEKMYV